MGALTGAKVHWFKRFSMLCNFSFRARGNRNHEDSCKDYYGCFDKSICCQLGRSSSNSHKTICMSSYPRLLPSWLRRQKMMPLIAECKYSTYPYFISITRVLSSFMYIITKKFDDSTCCLKSKHTSKFADTITMPAQTVTKPIHYD